MVAKRMASHGANTNFTKQDMKKYKKFRFRARPSLLMIECRIYPTRIEMESKAKKFTKNIYPNTDEIEAYCEGTPKLIPKTHLAIALFNHEYITHGLIAHEMFHAACYLMYRKKYRTLKLHIDMADESEELLADLTATFVDDFLKHFRPPLQDRVGTKACAEAHAISEDFQRIRGRS